MQGLHHEACLEYSREGKGDSVPEEGNLEEGSAYLEEDKGALHDPDNA